MFRLPEYIVTLDKTIVKDSSNAAGHLYGAAAMYAALAVVSIVSLSRKKSVTQMFQKPCEESIPLLGGSVDDDDDDDEARDGPRKVVSVDGGLTLQRGKPTRLSGKESMKCTHKLRALHEAILVGVGTVIADNPSLTTRLVPGSNPKPIVLDSRLRIPLDAKLLTSESCDRPIVITASAKEDSRTTLVERRKKIESLRKAGATVIECPTSVETGRIDLEAAMALISRSYESIMVEGGARVLTSFLESSRSLADEVVITIAPCLLIGGLKYAAEPGTRPRQLFPSATEFYHIGNDVVMCGSLS
eukprot:g2918.t1